MRLRKGDVVRCVNDDNELTGRVLAASDTDPQSVAVLITEGGICRNGGIMITNMLPLTVDYKAESVTDLWGAAWDIDVADNRADE